MSQPVNLLEAMESVERRRAMRILGLDKHDMFPGRDRLESWVEKFRAKCGDDAVRGVMRSVVGVDTPHLRSLPLSQLAEVIVRCRALPEVTA